MMKIMAWVVIVAICSLGFSCPMMPGPGPSLGGLDPALVGTWTGTAESPQGTVPATAQFSQDGSYSFTAMFTTNTGTWSTDSSKTPAWINVYNQRGQNWYGVYQITGDTLRWSENLGDRPTSLDSAPYRYTLKKSG